MEIILCLKIFITCLILPGAFCLQEKPVIPCIHGKGAKTACIEFDSRPTSEVYQGENISVSLTLILDRETLKEIYPDENKIRLVSIDDDITQGYWVKGEYRDRWSMHYQFTPSADGWGRMTTQITVQNAQFIDEVLLHMEISTTNATYKTGGKALLHVVQKQSTTTPTQQPEGSVTTDGRKEEDWQGKLIQCETMFNRLLENHENRSACPNNVTVTASNKPNNVEIFICCLLVVTICIHVFNTFCKNSSSNWTRKTESTSLQPQDIQRPHVQDGRYVQGGPLRGYKYIPMLLPPTSSATCTFSIRSEGEESDDQRLLKSANMELVHHRLYFERLKKNFQQRLHTVDGP